MLAMAKGNYFFVCPLSLTGRWRKSPAWNCNKQA